MNGSKWLKDHDAAGQRRMVEAFRSSERGQRLMASLPGAATTARTVADALGEAKADFTVGKRPMMTVLDADTACEVDGYVSICRLDSGKTLGVATPSYAIVQPSVVFAPLDVLVKRGEAEITRVQVCGEGTNLRISALVGATVINRPLGQLDRPDVLAHFLTLEADFSGRAKNLGFLETWRLICSNGATTKDTWAAIGIKHVGDATRKQMEAAAQLCNVTTAAQAEAETFQGMAERMMNARAFKVFAARLLDTVRGPLTEESAEAAHTKREREIRELEALFSGGQGNTGSSLWDGFNAVTEWVDHQKARAGKVRDRAKAFESATQGTGERVKRAARAMLARW